MSSPLDRTLPQAVLIRDSAGPRLVAQSLDVTFEQEEALLRHATKFGVRPPGVACPEALFALPVGDRVAITQVADLPNGTPDPPLAFRVLLMHQATYRLLGDPFAIADRFPPNWHVRGTIPTLEWPEEYLPPRQVGELLAILKASDSAMLLGGTQAILDGAALAVSEAPPQFVRHMWQLLPDKARCEVWPASFVFAAELPFQAMVLPHGSVPHFLQADQLRDYPEGRYELALQLAIESGDQAELNRLLNRKSSAEVLRLAAITLAVAIAAAVFLRLL